MGPVENGSRTRQDHTAGLELRRLVVILDGSDAYSYLFIAYQHRYVKVNVSKKLRPPQGETRNFLITISVRVWPGQLEYKLIL